MPSPTEYQRRHASQMEMERRLIGITPTVRGRIAHALLTAWQYRMRAMAFPGAEGRFWLQLARAAVSRAREDRITQAVLATWRDAIDRIDLTKGLPAPAALFSEPVSDRLMEKL